MGPVSKRGDTCPLVDACCHCGQVLDFSVLPGLLLLGALSTRPGPPRFWHPHREVLYACFWGLPPSVGRSSLCPAPPLPTPDALKPIGLVFSRLSAGGAPRACVHTLQVTAARVVSAAPPGDTSRCLSQAGVRQGMPSAPESHPGLADEALPRAALPLTGLLPPSQRPRGASLKRRLRHAPLSQTWPAGPVKGAALCAAGALLPVSSLAVSAGSRSGGEGASGRCGLPLSLCASVLPHHAGGPRQPPRRPRSAQPAPQNRTQLQNGASGSRQSAQVKGGGGRLSVLSLVPAPGVSPGRSGCSCLRLPWHAAPSAGPGWPTGPGPEAASRCQQLCLCSRFASKVSSLLPKGDGSLRTWVVRRGPLSLLPDPPHPLDRPSTTDRVSGLLSPGVATRACP